MVMSHDTGVWDVVIVGGGGSGLAAGVSCAEHGLKVLLLEKQPQLGGTTGIAVGSFTANGTRYQKRDGIDDSPQAHNDDAAKFAASDLEAKGNKSLREFFLTHAADTLQWLERMGIRFHGPSPEPPNRVPRMHNVVPNAKTYIYTLQMRLLRLGGRIATRAVVEDLLQRESGRVYGVTANVGGVVRDYHARRAVVLAAGDYSNNGPMIARYKGDAYAAIEGINPYATGEGHDLVAKVGGKLLNMDITYGPELRFVPPPRQPFTQLLPSSSVLARLIGVLLPLVPRSIVNRALKRLLVTWQHPENTLFDDGAILVNERGQRFCEETVSPDREIAVAHQPSKIAYVLLDESLIERYRGWPHFISTAPEIAYAYVDDYLRLRPDVAIKAGSLEELATLGSLPTTALLAAASGKASHGVPASKRPLQGSRWILLGPVKAYFTTTEGGAAIDKSFRVLNDHHEPIDGLYAVGQNGLGGQILFGHGLHIAWAITSGRLVGRTVAGH